MMREKSILGSDWAYLKIYTGCRFAENCLLRDIVPFIEGNKQECDRWFFIRYNDDYGFHLRVRFHALSESFVHIIIDWAHETFKELINNLIITRIEYGTYERELGRYGKEFYEQIESLFYYDSKCVCDMLGCLRATGSDSERWICGVVTIQSYLELFIPDIYSRIEFLCKMRDTYRKEFNVTNIESIRQIDKKYRENREMVETAMSSIDNLKVADAMHVRHDEIKSMLMSKNIIRQGLCVNLPDYIHMSFNRLFANENRKYEMVLYDFVSRYYFSILARMKYKGEKITNNLF